MNWDELTMAQKNELMQTYISNGVTSLDQMRSHFNSFALGGDKDNPNDPPVSKTPTLNEYLAKRAAQEQEQYYLQGSRNRKESYKLKDEIKVDTEPYKEELEFYERELKEATTRLNNNYSENEIKYISKLYELGDGIPKHLPSSFKHKYKESGFDFINYLSFPEIIKADKDVINTGYLECYLPNCIATATSNNPNPGHFITGNMSFRNNPGKYGWKEVSENEIRPGGLIQHLTDFGEPFHAVIFDSYDSDGKRLVNYSPGSYPNYKKHKLDWHPSDHEYFYNFVGNHQDSVRWNNEYEQLYGKHALGGYLFATGGPKKTFQEWSQAMKGKYPWLELDSKKAGYDYERYFNENYNDAIARLNEKEARHFTDKYKLPNHPTFSNESIYSQGPSIGGSWTEDNKFIPSIINVQQHPRIFKENRPYTEEEIYGY